MNFKLKDTFNKELAADPNKNNTRRQVANACFSYTVPRIPSAPYLIHTSKEVGQMLGLQEKDLESKDFLKIFSGTTVLENTNPYAMCYGGHQFGNWAGQLGDGRAINLFEVNHEEKQWALQLKGAGETPYSRTADGLAVLRSSIREYLCAEAMFYLGVPTTRSLSLSVTGDQVLRDMLYNGNSAYEKGAIVCRVSPSFIRFGSFQIFYARKDYKNLRELLNYTIRHFYPNSKEGTKEGYLSFFEEVTRRTMNMVIEWQRVGFVHGVMNTDNMSILGLTIDYGPYGWLEGYDPGWTPNTTDSSHKRYRFGQQAQIAYWNLYQLANVLVPIIEETKPLEDILNAAQAEFQVNYLKMKKAKLGFEKSFEKEAVLIGQLEEILQLTETDMTIFFRNLSNFKKDTFIDNKGDFLSIIKDAFYSPEEINGEILEYWKAWFIDYKKILQSEDVSDEKRKEKMDKVNPKFVLRNYMAQLAIDAADKGDYSLIEEFYELLKQPYAEQKEMEKWFVKRPEWARNKVGCSMLSCSS